MKKDYIDYFKNRDELFDLGDVKFL